MPPYTLDDLPRFSPWPARLLGAAPWTPRRKTPEEIIREYDREKWGPLLERVKAHSGPLSLDLVENWTFSESPPSLCWVGGGFELMTAREALDRRIALMRELLIPYLPAPAIVELGAGYGSILLALGGDPVFQGIPLIAGELSPTGVEVINMIAAAEGLPVRASTWDLNAARDGALAAPPGAVVFTSYATTCVPKLGEDFLAVLGSWKPRVVVHFESCFEHADEGSLFGMLGRRYIQVNDYNTNLLTLLKEREAAGSLRIVAERPRVFGPNPLLAASVVVWEPIH